MWNTQVADAVALARRDRRHDRKTLADGGRAGGYPAAAKALDVARSRVLRGCGHSGTIANGRILDWCVPFI